MLGKDFTKKIFFKFLLGCFFFLSSIFIFSSNAYADVIPPPDLNATSTTFNTCGEIVAPGTYILTGSITTSSGACITITSNDVVIDGQGSFSITGDVKGDGTGESNSGFNYIIKNITIVGNITASAIFGGNGGGIEVVNSTSSSVISNGGSDNYYGGQGGNIIIDNSRVGDLKSNGGVGEGFGGYGGYLAVVNNSHTGNINVDGGNISSGSDYGSAGSINITGDSVDLSGLSISAIGGVDLSGDTTGSGRNGYLNIYYSTSLNTTGALFSALTRIILNGGVDSHPFSGGSFPSILPGQYINNISQCPQLLFTGEYILSQNLTGDCVIDTSGIILNGGSDGQGGHFGINGNVIANGVDGIFDQDGNTISTPIAGRNITLSGINVAGNISSNGGAGYYIGARGGNVTILGSDVNISNHSISAVGGESIYYTNLGSSQGTGLPGFLTLTYSDNLEKTNTNLSALTSLVVNSFDLGAFAGGTFPDINFLQAGNISSCGILSHSGIYILTQNVTGDCNILANDVVIDGGNDNHGGHYTINGNILGNGRDEVAGATSTPGYKFTLQNITVTGIVASIGGGSHGSGQSSSGGGDVSVIGSSVGNVIVDGHVGGSITSCNGGNVNIVNSIVGNISANGGSMVREIQGNFFGNGGNITISDSVVGSVSANGGNLNTIWTNIGGLGNGGTINIINSSTLGIFSKGGFGPVKGGDGGIINITNSTGSTTVATSFPISANGGDSIRCGFGGSGGEINLTDSGGYDPVTSDAGLSQENTSCAAQGTTQGHSGSYHVSGTYSPLKVTKKIDVPVQTTVRVLGKRNVPDIKYTDGNLHGVEIPVVKLDPLKLEKLPTFGEGKSSFTFSDLISKFIFTPIPEDVSNQIKKIPKLFKLLTSVGIYHEQNRAALELNPILLSKFKDQDIPQGLLNVKNGSNIFLNLRITSDPKKQIVELVRTLTNTPIVVSVTPYNKEKVTGNWNGQKIDFKTKDGKVYEYSIVTPSTPGRYYISSSASPLVLAVDVVEVSKPVIPQKSFNIFNWFRNTF